MMSAPSSFRWQWRPRSEHCLCLLAQLPALLRVLHEKQHVATLPRPTQRVL